jgi:Family of unknown function (DUF6940)
MKTNWPFDIEELANGQARRYVLPSTPYCEVLEGWKQQAEFREFFSKLLGDCEFSAFTWETSPVSGRTLGRKFEFVLRSATNLDKMRSSPRPFAKQFKANSESVISFSNLPGDAHLVVPRPTKAGPQACSHLARFVRLGSEAQKHQFWVTLAEEITNRLCLKPLWVSTSKVGVHWLHARIDSRPKHYEHTPYLTFSDRDQD